MVKKLALWLLMLMIIIVVVLYFGMNLIVKTAIEHFGSRLTGTPVTVQSVEFEPFKGKALVTGLMIGNPKGFKTPYAFYFKRISASWQSDSLWTDHIKINKIELISPQLAYEINQRGTNFGTIKATVNNNTKSSEAKTQAKVAVPANSTKKVVVSELYIEKPWVSAGTFGIAQASIPLPSITLKNLGEKSGGMTFGQLGDVVLTTLLNSTKSIDLGGLVKNAQSAAKNVAGAAVSTVKTVGQGITTTGKVVVNTTTDTGKAIGERVKGWFSF